MIRSAALALLLLIIPLAVEAQATGAARTHTVLPGETLGEIARQHLGTAAGWERIFEANRDRISDPNRIQVGMVLQIPGGTPVAPQPATVLGVQIGGQPAVVVQTGPSYDERRALLRTVAFEPGAPAELDLSTRTVFFETGVREELGTRVMVQPPSAVPAVPPGVFQAAGWLVPVSDRGDRIGEVLGFADQPEAHTAQAAIQPYESVVLRLGDSAGVTIGEELLIYELRPAGNADRQVAVPTGIARVSEILAEGAVAEIVEEFARVGRGQYLTLPRTFPLSPGVHPAAVDSGVEAHLLAFQETKVLHFPGDFAFIDRGRSDGLAVGDELLGLTGGAEEGAPQREVARFQVVGLRDATATVRIVSIATPTLIRPGLAMTLDRKMP